jgi:hypothetical protein
VGADDGVGAGGDVGDDDDVVGDIGAAEGEDVGVDVGEAEGVTAADGVDVVRCTIVSPSPNRRAIGGDSCQDSPTRNPTPNASGEMINISRNSVSDFGGQII